MITSEWQLAEFRRVTRYSKLRRFLKPAEAGHLVNSLRHQAVVLEVLPTVELSPDPNDNPVLAMAEARRAQYLVTGDKKDLLALFSPQRSRTTSARCSTNCDFLFISDTKVLSLYHQNQKFGIYLLRLVVGRLVQEVERLKAQR